MFLAWPIWLVLLAPWAGLTLWLLWGQLDRRGVPFVKLWRGEMTHHRKPRRAWAKPPLALIALLAAMFLAIVAAAGPMVRIGLNPPAIPPEPSDVKIDCLAVRAGPTTQAMVRLLNQSDFSTAKLTIRADGKNLRTDQVTLPARGQMHNYFLIVPAGASAVEAEVECDGVTRIDHRVQATRRAAWPIVEAATPLPPELRRMIDVYGRHRPPGERSKHIAVLSASAVVPGEEPAAIVADDSAATTTLSNLEPPAVLDSPLTKSVDWEKILSRARASSPPPGDWQPIITAAGVTVLAVHQPPVKRVWIGFQSDEFSHYPDFVIFWSNVFDWLGDVGQDYESAPSPSPAPTTLAEANPSAKPLAAPLFLAASGLICISAVAWKAPTPPWRDGFQS
ncbi:MAG: hypothetical protein ABSH08_04160 [Tepidisphaeraceae bacterium]|jgi:hypothetical protein